MTEGYWANSNWASGYWASGYWGQGGAAPSAASAITVGGVTPRKPTLPLQLGLTLNGELVWVYPIKLKKGD